MSENTTPGAAEVSSTLPSLDASVAVDPARVEALERDGHVGLPGLFTRDEIAAFRPAIMAAIDEHERTVPALDKKLYMFDSLWKKSEVVRRFVHSPRIARVAADALGVDAVRLWRDIPFCRPPGDDAPWHYDLTWEPLGSDRLVSVWIALNDIEENMGALTFASGTHRIPRYEVAPPIRAEQARFTQTLRERGHSIVSYAPMSVGDASLHFGWTLHAALPNTSTRRREAIAVFFFPDGVRVAVPPTPEQERDAQWHRVQAFQHAVRLGGRQVGDLADGPDTPLVFRR